MNVSHASGASAQRTDALAGMPADVRDRVLMAAGRSLTVSDARRPDHPLVWVNPAFERSTGFSFADAVGRNCRFLQGLDTDPASVKAISEALRQRRGIEVTLLNHRFDGSAFWNELSISPVFDDDGVLTHFVGMQADVTDRVLAERSRAKHLAAERAATHGRERAGRRLELLREATALLSSTLDIDESLAHLSSLVVPELADWCVVDLLARGGSGRRAAAHHRDADAAPLLRRLEELAPLAMSADAPVTQVLGGSGPLLLASVPDELLRAFTPSQELLDIYQRIGFGSALVVPLGARRAIVGSLTLVRCPGEPSYTGADLAVAADLARRAALAVDNARLYTREHEVAEALQRSLLPEVLPVAGVTTAARYLPGTATAQIGGDWYDVFDLPDGAVGMAIGDVMGHDLAAAAAMGQLRSVLRSYAWKGLAPAEVLDSLDELVQGLAMAQLATTVYARLEFVEPLPRGRRLGDPPVQTDRPRSALKPPVLRYANAGHLPPLVRAPDGTVRALEGGRSVLIGAPPGGPRTEACDPIERGSVLLFYTDGLVERRRRPIDEGLELLTQAVATAPGDPESLCDHILDRLHDNDHDDDVALLAVRVDPPG